MKVRVICVLGTGVYDEVIECNSYFISGGAYIFLDVLSNGGWNSYDYKDVIKTFPVDHTIVERI